MEEEENDKEIPPPPPTVTEARDTIKTLRHFIEGQSGADHQTDVISNLHDCETKIYVSKSRQTSITNFFKKV